MDVENLKLKSSAGKELLLIDANTEEQAAAVGSKIVCRDGTGNLGITLTTNNFQFNDNYIVLYNSSQQRRVMISSGDGLQGETGGIIRLKASNDSPNPMPDGSPQPSAIVLNAFKRSVQISGSSGQPLIGLNQKDGVLGLIGTTILMLFQVNRNRSDDNNASIHLDGRGGDIRAGGSETGTDGDLILFSKNKSNAEKKNASIHLVAESGDIIIRDQAGNNVFHLKASDATLNIGAAGNAGDIILHDNSGKDSIQLNGGNGDVILRSPAGSDVFHLRAADASFFVGAAGNAGDIILRNSAGKDTIKMDGEAGDIILQNADCAEEFDVLEEVEPGTVMVFSEDGKLSECTKAYDKKVAGVISGAGQFKPAIILDRKNSDCKRAPLALMGKAYCKVDASYAPIEAGDLLTTSDTLGHAMKVSNMSAAFGSVIGKAMKPLKENRGLIPVFITLQ